MKIFLKQTLLFLSPLMVLMLIAEILLQNIPNDYKYKKSYLDAHSGELKVLVLGNSHAYFGINPEFSSENMFNAAYISQSLNYDYELLKKYRDRFDSLRCIILSVSYPSLYTQLESNAEAWRVKNYTLYYGIHNSLKISDYSEVLSNKMNINAERIYQYYFLHQSGFPCSENGWGTNYSSQKKIDLEEKGKTAAQRHTKKDTSLVITSISILQEIIAFAEKRNIQVLIITTPAFHSYTDRLSNTQLDRTVNAMKELDKHSAKCTYVNFLADPSFTAGDFYDGDHLNDRGAQKLTVKIDSIVSRLK